MEKTNVIIFTDIGDTIIDEGTEIRTAPGGVVHKADCIEGAKEAMLALYAKGYTIALVADGLDESFHNTMRQNGLEHIFAAWVVSEKLNTHKPDRRMFEAAMEQLSLDEADKRRIIMVGNNLSRDVAGANRFGIRSVHLCWSPRYPHEASVPEEEPDYRIFHPSELPALVEALERELRASV